MLRIITILIRIIAVLIYEPWVKKTETKKDHLWWNKIIPWLPRDCIAWVYEHFFDLHWTMLFKNRATRYNRAAAGVRGRRSRLLTPKNSFSCHSAWSEA